ncbi:MAG: Mrp/NBP35 family ATP-binding protein [Synergistetes bacterium]|nr:Mrp/NBP35 family ATP-binding protein [Synergistota bacterium]
MINELQKKISENLKNVRKKFAVMSGKGGVGKSTVSANLAVGLALEGKKVGILDLDIHGPNIPKLLGLEGALLSVEGDKIKPVSFGENLKVVSMAFLLKDKGMPVIWRGPLKMKAIGQFLSDVDWGELDYLIIDLPPGTGDEPLSLAQLLGKLDGAIIVTTPQEVALLDVEKAVNFARELNMPILGVVENMSGFKCPHCGNEINIFGKGGGEKAAREWNVPFLGRVPFDPRVVEWSDSGRSFLRTAPESEISKAFSKVIERILKE